MIYIVNRGVLLSESHFIRFCRHRRFPRSLQGNLFFFFTSFCIPSRISLNSITHFVYTSPPCWPTVDDDVFFKRLRDRARCKCVQQRLTAFIRVGLGGIIVTAHKPNNFGSLISLVANIKEKINNFTVKKLFGIIFFFFIICKADESYIIMYTAIRWFGGTLRIF